MNSLDNNDISIEGAVALGKALKDTETLTKLL